MKKVAVVINRFTQGRYSVEIPNGQSNTTKSGGEPNMFTMAYKSESSMSNRTGRNSSD